MPSSSVMKEHGGTDRSQCSVAGVKAHEELGQGCGTKGRLETVRGRRQRALNAVPRSQEASKWF